MLMDVAVHSLNAGIRNVDWVRNSLGCYLAYCNHEQNSDLPTSFCGGSTCTTKNMQMLVVIIGLIMEKQKVTRKS